MATLFASDLHLDSEAPWAIDAFLAFLAGPARSAEALYLLGDLFEVWVGDDDDSPDHVRTCAGLKSLADSGVAVYVIHGNRDFLLGGDFAHRTGVKLLPDPVLVDLYGVPTLLSHGDVFCTEDPSYQQLRSIVRRPRFQQRFLGLPLEARRKLASAGSSTGTRTGRRSIREWSTARIPNAWCSRRGTRARAASPSMRKACARSRCPADCLPRRTGMKAQLAVRLRRELRLARRDDLQASRDLGRSEFALRELQVDLEVPRLGALQLFIQRAHFFGKAL